MRKNTKTASDAQIAIGFAAVCFTFGLLTGLIIALAPFTAGRAPCGRPKQGQRNVE